jgi:predicted tellurium resistance membrane protein TerC
VADLLTVEALMALLTLTALEIVLGIDNIVFIAILTGRLKPEEQDRARRVGLIGAMLMRILLLLTLTWMMKLTQPLFEVLGKGFSGRDLILIIGGFFLIGKATHEIHQRIEQPEEEAKDLRKSRTPAFWGTIVQIMILDIVFSLDSVITAVGMARQLPVMVAAVVVAVGIMLIFSGAISRFIEEHPTLKMLALAFLLMVGVVLVADGVGQHIQKGYIYTAMAFSLLVELLNLRALKNARRARASAAEGESSP